MIINIKEESIKVTTDEGEEQVYIKNKEEVIEEQGSSDLTEEKNIEIEKEIDLIGRIIDKISLYYPTNKTKNLMASFSLFFIILIFLFVSFFVLEYLIIFSFELAKSLEYSNKGISPFVFFIIVPLYLSIRVFIASFTYTIKEIERAIKWAIYEVKRKKEGL